MLLRIEVINSAETFQVSIGDAIILILSIHWISKHPFSDKVKLLLKNFNMIYFLLRIEMKLNYFTLIKTISLVLFIIY